MTFNGPDGVSSIIAYNGSDTASISNNFLFRRRRATAGALSAGDRMGGVLVQGYNGGTFHTPIAIEFYTEEAFSASTAGSYIQFATTAIGSTTRTARWVINAAGHFIPSSTVGAYDIGDSAKRVGTGYFKTINTNALTVTGPLTAPLTWNNNTVIVQVNGGGKLLAGTAGYTVIARPGANDATVNGVLAFSVQGFDGSVRMSIPDGLTKPAVIANSSLTVGGSAVWHVGNMGSGSGLDADLLDGLDSTYFRNATNLNAGTLATARLPALTGDVTSSAGSATTTIANNAVTLAKMATIGGYTVMGNDTASATNPKALTVAETKTLLALNNVDNTSDANKPISTAVQTALNGKVDTTGYTGPLSGGRVFTGYDANTANSISCSNWFRSNGNTGWMSDTYGIGIYATDGTYVRTYNGAKMAAADFAIASDRRLKTNIAPLQYRGALSPVTFQYRSNGESDIGFIAQDVQEQYPELVSSICTEEGEHLQISYSKLTAVLAAQVNLLEERLAAVEAELKSLKGG